MEYEQIMQALRNAHAAGDAEGARRLAQMAREARQTQAAPSAMVAQEVPVAAPMSPPPAGDAMALMRDAGLAGAPSTGPSNFSEMTDQIGIAGAEIADERIGPYADPALALAQGLTFGGSDEALGWLTSQMGRTPYKENTDAFRTELDDFREESPLAAYGTEIAGAMAIPFGAIKQGGNLGIRAIQSALLGGSQGALYGFLSGEGDAGERAPNMLAPAAIGGAIGAAIPVASRVLSSIDDAAARNAAVREQFNNAPTPEAVRAQASALYDQIDNLDVNVNAGAFDDWLGQTTQRLQREGMDILPGTPLNPQASRAMQTGEDMVAQMSQDPTAAIPFPQLDQFRRRLGTAAANMQNPADSRLGSIAIGELDDFVQRLGPDDIATGDIATLQDLIPKARELWAQASRAGLIDDAIDNSQNYLSNQASGLRNQFARILRNPQLRRGFSAEEIAAMRRVISGSIPERLVHLLGGGIGQITQMGLGAALGSGAGTMGAMIGTGAGALTSALTQRASENIAVRNAEIVRALIASGALRNLNVGQLSDGTKGIIEALLGAGSRAPTTMAAQN